MNLNPNVSASVAECPVPCTMEEPRMFEPSFGGQSLGAKDLNSEKRKSLSHAKAWRILFKS